MRIHAAHAMFIHCACHRLQLASVQAAENVTEIKQIRHDGDYLETVQLLKKLRPGSALNTPELKVVNLVIYDGYPMNVVFMQLKRNRLL